MKTRCVADLSFKASSVGAELLFDIFLQNGNGAVTDLTGSEERPGRGRRPNVW